MYAELGDNCVIQEGAIIGFRYREECSPARLGHNAVIRAGTIIYADVEIGDDFKTGHFVLIREDTHIGSRAIIGTGTVIDGYTEIGSFVKIESRVYIPTHTKIGSHVFIGPGAVLTNDKYPLRRRDEYEPHGPEIEDNVTIGANATILPGIRIGEGAMVGAGSVVTHDVPPWSLAIGVPARFHPLPENLREGNKAKHW